MKEGAAILFRCFLLSIHPHSNEVQTVVTSGIIITFGERTPEGGHEPTEIGDIYSKKDTEVFPPSHIKPIHPDVTSERSGCAFESVHVKLNGCLIGNHQINMPKEQEPCRKYHGPSDSHDKKELVPRGE
jgi:hypothetical protein